MTILSRSVNSFENTLKCNSYGDLKLVLCQGGITDIRMRRIRKRNHEKNKKKKTQLNSLAQLYIFFYFSEKKAVK